MITFTLSNGVSMPSVGLGTFLMSPDKAEQAVYDALKLGYRMVETTTGELKAEGTSGHFFYDRSKGRPVALKKALPEVYGILQSLT